MSKSKKESLNIKNLKVKVEGEEILKGVNLSLSGGQIHALMGPNGSGKSTLAYALAGHPNYEITSGSIELMGKDITDKKPEERAKAGLFLAFQHPLGIEGVSSFNLVKTALSSLGKESPPEDTLKKLKKLSKEVGLGEEFLKRDLNVGFSGGEKKRSEVLQALALKAKFAVFDEVDSGLDIDALRSVAGKVRGLSSSGSGILVITHYRRILDYLNPDFVHVMVGGEIVESGGKELAEKLEKKGYESYR